MSEMIVDEIECPECGELFDISDKISTSDYGEMNTLHETECPLCVKTIQFTTDVHLSFEAKKVPCKNSKSHKWKKIKGFPCGYYTNLKRCQYCYKEEMIDNNLKYNISGDKWVKKIEIDEDCEELLEEYKKGETF